MNPKTPRRKPVPEERAVRSSRAPLKFDDQTIPAEPPPGTRSLPADATLNTVDGSAIGAGDGRDEAQDARRKPLPRREVKRLQQRVSRSGGSVRQVEPYETGAGSPGRARNRRP